MEAASIDSRAVRLSLWEWYEQVFWEVVFVRSTNYSLEHIKNPSGFRNDKAVL